MLWAIAIITEIILFLYIGSLVTRFNLRMIMLFCLFLAVIRWLIMAYFIDNTILLILAQCSHAFYFWCLSLL